MKNKNNYKHSFVLPFILNNLNISVPDDATPLFNFSLGIFFFLLSPNHSCFLFYFYIIPPLPITFLKIKVMGKAQICLY